jgi:tryptophan-rich sensory protein
MKKRSNPKKKKSHCNERIIAFIVSFAIVFVVAFLGSMFTKDDVKSAWYYENKPFFTPPNWVFPVAWAILFILIAVAMPISWLSARFSQKAAVAFGYGANLFFNLMWSFLFFFMRLPVFALVDIVLLWCSIWYLVVFNWRINKTAAWLLVPYLLWVTFATALNLFFII